MANRAAQAVKASQGERWSRGHLCKATEQVGSAERLPSKVTKLYNAKKKEEEEPAATGGGVPARAESAGRRSRWGGASPFVSHFSLRHIFSTLPF